MMQTLRIQQLGMDTGQVEALRGFYAETLGLPVIAEEAGSFTVQTGETRLKFNRAAPGEMPFYHFAFNIPENKIEAAEDWTAGRTALLPDPESGEMIRPWPAWDAHSIYFADPAGNIVEFIARHGLHNPAPGAFGPQDVLYASEIGLPVPDVRKAAGFLQERLGAAEYSRHEDIFCALGDARGLFILVKTGRPWWPTQTAHAGEFPLEVSLDWEAAGALDLPGAPYRILFI